MFERQKQQILGPLLNSPMAPFMQMAMSFLADSGLTGAGAFLRYSNMNTNMSTFANWQNAHNAQMRAEMFGNYTSVQSMGMTRELMQGMYRAMGHDDISARYHAFRPGQGLLAYGVDTFLGSQWRTGLQDMYGAASSRRYALGISGTDNDYARSYTAAGDRLLDMHFRSGSFGSLDFRSVGAIGASLIRSGRYDHENTTGTRTPLFDVQGRYLSPDGSLITDAGELERLRRIAPRGDESYEQLTTADGKSSGWGITSRADKISRDVKEYGRALETLQDVIGGDMSELLNKLDRMFGSSATAISANRLQNIANNVRHAVNVSGVDPQTMNMLSGIGVAYTAPYGGTELQSLQMAGTAAYFMGAGINVEGVKSDLYGSSVMMHQSNRLLSGDVKYMSAAYRAYADMHGLDVHNRSSYERFRAALGDTSLTAASLAKWTTNLIGPGNDAYFSSLVNSTSTMKLASEFGMTGDMLLQDVDNVNRIRRSDYGTLMDALNRDLGTSYRLEDLLPGDFTRMNSQQVEEQFSNRLMGMLQSSGMGRAEARRLATTFGIKASGIHSNAAAFVFRNMPVENAEQIAVSADAVRRMREVTLFQDNARRIYGDVLDGLGDRGSSGGLGGILQGLMSNGTYAQNTLVDVLLPAIGLTPEQVKAFGSAGEVLNAERMNAFLGNNYDTIASQYRAITGKSFQATGDRQQDIRAMTQGILQIAQASDTLTGGIFAGYQKRGAVLPKAGDGSSVSYAQLRSRATTASMALQRDNLTDTQRAGFLADMKAWAEATDGDNARLIETAIDTDRVQDLYSAAGRASLQKVVADRSRATDFLDAIGATDKNRFDENYRNQARKAVFDLQRSSGNLGGAERERLMNAVKLEDGKLTMDKKSVQDLLDGSGDAKSVWERMEWMKSHQEKLGISGDTAKEMMIAGIKLPALDDPLAGLTNIIKSGFENVVAAIGGK